VLGVPELGAGSPDQHLRGYPTSAASADRERASRADGAGNAGCEQPDRPGDQDVVTDPCPYCWRASSSRTTSPPRCSARKATAQRRDRAVDRHEAVARDEPRRDQEHRQRDQSGPTARAPTARDRVALGDRSRRAPLRAFLVRRHARRSPDLSLTGPVGRWRAVRLARGPRPGRCSSLLCLAVYLPGAFRIPPGRPGRGPLRAGEPADVRVRRPARAERHERRWHGDGGLVVPDGPGPTPPQQAPADLLGADRLRVPLHRGRPDSGTRSGCTACPRRSSRPSRCSSTWRIGVLDVRPEGGMGRRRAARGLPHGRVGRAPGTGRPALLACTTLALWGMWESLVAGTPRPHRTWLGLARRSGPLWIGIGLGVLAKGPITPMVAALTALLALCRQGRTGAWLRAARPISGSDRRGARPRPG
jgi:hypothetical protein